MKRTFMLAAAAVAMLAGTAATVGPAVAAGGTPAVDAGGARIDPSQLEQLHETPGLAEGGVAKQMARVSIAAGPGPQTYLVRLADPAVPTYTGGTPGLAATATGGAKLDPESRPVRAYEGFLQQQQASFVERAGGLLGRDLDPLYTYRYAVNGMAVALTADEVAVLAADPSVVSITPDQLRQPHTDAGPTLINADAAWNASAELGLPADYRGEGMVIGIIDTGISPENESFADPAPGDGYDHTNPLGAGNYVGVCNPEEPSYDPAFTCNDKLIGAWTFVAGQPRAVDYDGHGSHTASTAGGNVVGDVVVTAASGFVTPAFEISGVAPHANIIAYLGCCSLGGLTASIDQAIADGVDVINYSIGSSAPSELWTDFDSVGFLNARAAGVFVATSNGNDGPGFATTGSPADAPWIISVGASTHTRYNSNVLTGLTSSEGALPDILGKSVTGGLAEPAPIVYAGAFGDPLCQSNSANDFTGLIVVCDRGVNGRVEKSVNVAAQGGIGFVLVNDTNHGNSLTGDEFALPGVFITNADGTVLKNWLAVGSGHVATIAGTAFLHDPADGDFADFMASFSSRGPNRAVDTIVPSVSAPGVDILAALRDFADGNGGNVHGFISGTSMASPHVAGAGALVMQARPDWTPAEIQSALMSTADPGVRNHDGAPATPYAQGNGRIDVGAAISAGLLFDETIENYVASNPAEGGDPRALNLPSFANTQCLASCSWTRVASVPASAPAGVSWSASVVTDDGITLDVGLSATTVSPGDTVTITVTADVEGAAEDVTHFGRITLTPDHPAVPAVTMPVAIVPTGSVVPARADMTTRRDAGGDYVGGIQTRDVTDVTGTVGWVAGTQVAGALVEDPTNGNPYDDLTQVDVYTVDVPAGSEYLIVETIAAEMADADLFVGTGTAPSVATEVCASTTPTGIERCHVPDAAGTYWVLVQNWAASADGAEDAYTLSYAAVAAGDNGTGTVIGPDGFIPAGTPYEVAVTWNLPGSQAGEVYYGFASLGGLPDTADHLGGFPVRLVRLPDDVTKTASVSEAAPGDQIDYTITVEPNTETDADLTYTIVDTVPDGFTIDPASVTGGGVVDGQTITWTVTQEAPVLGAYYYELSTSATNPFCGTNGLDLYADSGFAPNPDLDGDTVSGGFIGGAPYAFYGESYPHLVVSEDGLATIPGGYGGQPWAPQTLPDPAAPNGVIAPLWGDLEASVANDRGVIVAGIPETVTVVQWQDLMPWGEDPADLSNSVGAFQAWVWSGVDPDFPEIQFEYLDLGVSVPGGATIGVENGTGTAATSFLDAGDHLPLLAPGDVVCFDQINEPGNETGPVSLSYSVTVGDVDTGTYTNAAAHDHDGPFSEVEVASADVAVTAPVCHVEYKINSTWFRGHTVQVTIRNIGDATIDGWELGWTLPDGHGISAGWSGAFDVSGSDVTVSNVGWNAKIKPNKSVTFGFIGNQPGGVAKVPNGFALNGQPCTQSPDPSPTTPPPVECRVQYTVTGSWPGGHAVQILIRNTGSAPIDGWELQWQLPAGHGIAGGWSADYSVSGSTVTATDAGWNATIQPNAHVQIGFIGTQPGNTATAPTAFTVNGQACTT